MFSFSQKYIILYCGRSKVLEIYLYLISFRQMAIYLYAEINYNIKKDVKYIKYIVEFSCLISN